jgi:hypothetical protein
MRNAAKVAVHAGLAKVSSSDSNGTSAARKSASLEPSCECSNCRVVPVVGTRPPRSVVVVAVALAAQCRCRGGREFQEEQRQQGSTIKGAHVVSRRAPQHERSVAACISHRLLAPAAALAAPNSAQSGWPDSCTHALNWLARARQTTKKGIVLQCSHAQPQSKFAIKVNTPLTSCGRESNRTGSGGCDVDISRQAVKITPEGVFAVLSPSV